MATSIEQICHFLDRRDWTYKADKEDNTVISAVEADNVEDFLIVIRLSENGEFLQFITPKLLTINDHVYKGVLLQTIAHIQYQAKMIRFEYDPTDGEIRASIELPLEDSFLTEKQFNRCLNSLVHMVDNIAMPRFKSVLTTGEDSGMPNIGKLFLKEFSSELRAMLEILEMLDDM